MPPLLMRNITPGEIVAIIEQLIAEGYIDGEFVANYTVVEGYDKANGKFPNNLGNVAVVDCSSLAIQIGLNLFGLGDKVLVTNYSEYAIPIYALGYAIQRVDFCQTGMTIEGVLEKAVDYYIIDKNAKMKSKVIGQGRELMEKLSL
jgi:hypothetical protein